jgi:hypothetical protein
VTVIRELIQWYACFLLEDLVSYLPWLPSTGQPAVTLTVFVNVLCFC